MTKHTSGPWELIHSKDGSGDIGIKAPGVVNIIAECFADMRFPGERNTTEARANARLITAAPDLLEALEAVNLARLSDDPKDWQRATDLTDAAFAKVEGRT